MKSRRIRSLDVYARLLCFLTLSELFAFVSHGEWLRVDHLVESTRIWLHRRGYPADWRVRIQLSRTAADLARRLAGSENQPLNLRAEARRYFTREMEINFASPRVVVIYAECVDRLARGG
ncbi:hypothetical protein SAMN05446635_0479 [Burkholderia sp. OK233]|nr:hypothetical protein SAMN05446635_0479 [Burkholderia sp. OK233]